MPFLRVANADGTIDYESATTIPLELLTQHKTLKHVKPNDIVLTKGGSVARVGFVTKKAAVSRGLIFVNSSVLHIVDANFLYLYFLTTFANSLLIRSSSQSVQAHLTLTLVKEIPYFKATQGFKKKLFRVVKASEATQSQSLKEYERSEELLADTIGVANIVASAQSINTKLFSHSFISTGRLDAEYYQPKFENLLTLLRKDGLTIGDVAPARHKRFESLKAGDFDYIEIGGMRGDGTVASERLPCAEALSLATQRVRRGDIVTSTVRPIRRLSALITPSQNDYVCSSGFVVLQPAQTTAETLLVYLRLPIIWELMNLHTSASLYPAISEKDLLGLSIPKIPAAVQNEITSLVQQSFTLKAKSERLLEAAKRAVEIAIEQDEAAGMAYLARKGAST